MWGEKDSEGVEKIGKGRESQETSEGLAPEIRGFFRRSTMHAPLSHRCTALTFPKGEKKKKGGGGRGGGNIRNKTGEKGEIGVRLSPIAHRPPFFQMSATGKKIKGKGLVRRVVVVLPHVAT